MLAFADDSHVRGVVDVTSSYQGTTWWSRGIEVLRKADAPRLAKPGWNDLKVEFIWQQLL